MWLSLRSVHGTCPCTLNHLQGNSKKEGFPMPNSSLWKSSYRVIPGCKAGSWNPARHLLVVWLWENMFTFLSLHFCPCIFCLCIATDPGVAQGQRLPPEQITQWLTFSKYSINMNWIKIYFKKIATNQIIQFRNGQRTWKDIFQQRYMNGQQVHKKVLNITNH